MSVLSKSIKDELKEIIEKVPIFKTNEEKEKLLVVLSSLSLGLISLSKASEIMGVDREVFLQLLDIINYDFSYLKESDIEIEKSFQ
jgi:predicted HTH domain antitoxin